MNGSTRWELEVRPHRAVRVCIVVAGALLILFVFGGIFLRASSTGVNFRASDQAAMIVIGVLLAGGVLMLTRPRLRAGKNGVAVRNVFGEKEIEWDLIQGLSFPDKKAWARIELPDDEYVPVMAIRSNDRERAVDAVERFRALGAKYAGGAHPDE